MQDLNFICQQCGKCCKDLQGYVYVTNKELEKISRGLKITNETFKKKYLSKNGKLKPHLKAKKNGSCIFLKSQRCSIYEFRPKQCRTYPFWSENFKSKRTLNSLRKKCVGIQIESSN